MNIQPALFATKSFKKLLLCVGVVALGLSAIASPYELNDKLSQWSDIPNRNNRQYQLALAQVFSEMCPSLLNVRQQAQFNEAYQNQLKLFMPTSANPKKDMKQLFSQKDYQAALQSVRAWTASFPPSENLAACQEFAQSSLSF